MRTLRRGADCLMPSGTVWNLPARSSAFDEVDLPLVPPPSREQLERDAQSQDIHVKLRAQKYLRWLATGQSPPESIKLPLALVRLDGELTFVLMGGEVVVDY